MGSLIKTFMTYTANLQQDNIEDLAALYHPQAVFIHPWKTVRGRDAISRQWRMCLKYNKNTRIVFNNYLNDILYWTHYFDVDGETKFIRGDSILEYDKEYILKQVDRFDVSEMYRLYGHTTNKIY